MSFHNLDAKFLHNVIDNRSKHTHRLVLCVHVCIHYNVPGIILGIQGCLTLTNQCNLPYSQNKAGKTSDRLNICR